MTKLQILSDLHFEFMRDFGHGFMNNLDPEDVDVLVVAGDLAPAKYLEGALGVVCGIYCPRYPKVVFVAGNHEYYGCSFDALMDLREQVLRKYKNLYWLHRDAIEVNGTRILGASLWFPEPKTAWQRAWGVHGMMDYKVIRDFEPRVYEEAVKDAEFIRREARQDDVVVTHHLPHPMCVAPQFEGSPLNHFFVHDLSDVTRGLRPRIWAFGHTHTPVDKFVDNTRMICNPLGYPHEGNDKFNNKLVIEV